MTTKEIIQEFKRCNLTILSENKLLKYIEYCQIHNQLEHTKFKTSYHHILPQAESLPFREYSDLKENSWNGTYLLHKDHYYAHYLLAQAVEHWAILCSFSAMNNQDLKNKRLQETNLIGKEEYDILMKRKYELMKHKKHIHKMRYKDYSYLDFHNEISDNHYHYSIIEGVFKKNGVNVHISTIIRLKYKTTYCKVSDNAGKMIIKVERLNVDVIDSSNYKPDLSMTILRQTDITIQYKCNHKEVTTLGKLECRKNTNMCNKCLRHSNRKIGLQEANRIASIIKTKERQEAIIKEFGTNKIILCKEGHSLFLHSFEQIELYKYKKPICDICSQLYYDNTKKAKTAGMEVVSSLDDYMNKKILVKYNKKYYEFAGIYLLPFTVGSLRTARNKYSIIPL